MKKKTEQTEVKTEPTDLKARIAELEAKIRESEEAQLARVCKALGIAPSEVTDQEEKASKPQPMVRMFVTHPVRVNTMIYQGDTTVPLDTARVIQQAIGDRRQRLTKEMTGNDYVLKEILGGGFAPQLIAQVDSTGERISS